MAGVQVSDYASFVTEPFWSSEFPRVYIYFVGEEHTEVKGEKGTVAFAGIIRDHSENGLLDQLRAMICAVGDRLPEGRDIVFTAVFDAGSLRRTLAFSARVETEDSARHTAEWRLRYIQTQHDFAAAKACANRDAAANEGMDSPDLDGFLEKRP